MPLTHDAARRAATSCATAISSVPAGTTMAPSTAQTSWRFVCGSYRQHEHAQKPGMRPVDRKVARLHVWVGVLFGCERRMQPFAERNLWPSNSRWRPNIWGSLAKMVATTAPPRLAINGVECLG